MQKENAAAVIEDEDVYKRQAENRICPAAVTWEKQMWADLYQQYSLRPNG